MELVRPPAVDDLPVIGHEAVSEDPDRHAAGYLFQDAVEGHLVFLLEEKSGPHWCRSLRDRRNRLESNGPVVGPASVLPP